MSFLSREGFSDISHDVGAHDMPRERLLRLGARALADYELLAILLRTGGGGVSVLEFARKILRERGGLVGLLTSQKEQLLPIKGLGQAKVAELLAVAELARRFVEAELVSAEVRFSKPDEVRQFLLMNYKGLRFEEMGVLLLDRQHRLLAFERFTDETPGEVRLPMRAVLAKVLHYQASAVILVHNHPAGSTNPSAADKKVTRKLDELFQSVEVDLLDHFIVSGNDVISMRENGAW